MRALCTVLIAALMFSTNAVAGAETILHAGDKIDVTVFNHSELSGLRTIDASGNVALPVIGSVHAANMSANALGSIVQRKLVDYVRDVAVEVKLDTQNTTVFVAGGPNGSIPFVPGMTLGSAVAFLGWPTPTQPQAPNTPQVATYDSATGTANLINGPIDFRHVILARNATTMGPYDVIAMREAGQMGPALEPNDTIQLVNKPIAVTVSGEVEHPGIAYLNPTEPLSQALKQVGGSAASARIDQLQLVRDGQTTFVSAGDVAFTQPAQNGDAVIVPKAIHVDVLGTVERPGDTALRGSDTLVSAIYYAGGPAKYANLRAVQIIRNGQKTQFDLGRVKKGADGTNPVLHDGDVVFVPEGSTFGWSDVWAALGSIGAIGFSVNRFGGTGTGL
jgi:protein involved in polysaccharide export with SLBB domain